jgi:hypothetical protein
LPLLSGGGVQEDLVARYIALSSSSHNQAIRAASCVAVGELQGNFLRQWKPRVANQPPNLAFVVSHKQNGFEKQENKILDE